MAQRGDEKGISDGDDHGAQFLDARDDGAPPPAPPPVPTDGGPGDEGEGGGNKNQTVLIVLILVALIGGGVVLAVVLTGGGGDSGDDLVTASPGVSISPDERPEPTTTTTIEPTTTTEATTTTTSTSTTTSTLPTTTTIAGFPAPPGAPPPGGPVFTNPTPAARTCPGGFVENRLDPANITGESKPVPPRRYQIEATGRTINSTNAAIVLGVSIPISYTLADGSHSVSPLPAQHGQTIPAGSTLDWTLSYTVVSNTQPALGQVNGGFTWADPANAGCAVS